MLNINLRYVYGRYEVSIAPGHMIHNKFHVWRSNLGDNRTLFIDTIFIVAYIEA